MGRVLTLEFARVTEAAAVAAARWMGLGDKIAADDAATSAMRSVFDTINIEGTVVIGEGEMDEAPMLFIGEKVGTGSGPAMDIAVDPLEGTNILVKGVNGAIAVLAAGPKGSLLHAPDMYMDKIAVGPEAYGRIHIDAPIEENLKEVADALKKRVQDLTVVILDRERHEELIKRVRNAGARIQLITDGDVSPSVATAIDGSGVDMMVGKGGGPEGVISAAALRCLGGDMQARLMPETDEEIRRCHEMGITDVNKILTIEDLARSEDIIFAATGITNSNMLKGVQFTAIGARTHTIVMRGKSGTVRFIEAIHRFDKKPSYNINNIY